MINFSLQGKVALVTGAAYGIGMAIAEAYAEAGAKIAFNCRSQHHLDQAMADYKAKGIEALGYICDVTKEDSPGHRHRSDSTFHRFQSCHPRHDQEGTWQDHQHLLNDE